MYPSAKSFYVDFTNKPKVTGNCPDFFEEAYTDHRCNLDIVHQQVLGDVKIANYFIL